VQSTGFIANPGCRISQVVGLSITEHIITHFVEHILGDQFCDGLKVMKLVLLPRMQGSPIATLVA
jgi:hypothetical protein